MIYNYSQTCFTNLASIIRAKTTLNKCMQHSCFTSMFHMFRSMVLVIMYIIRHGYLGCLMMHNMHDLQCLNAGITPGCYTRNLNRIGHRELRESSSELTCRSRRNRMVFMVIRIFEETTLELAIVVRLADP